MKRQTTASRLGWLFGLLAVGAASAQSPASPSNKYTLSVLDNDPVPAVSFASAAQSLTEGNSGSTSIGVSVNLSAASGRTVSVPYTVTGTATSPADHDAASGTFTFDPGQTSVTVSLSVVGETAPEAAETVIFTLGTPTGGTATLASPSTHTVTIDNDDIPPDSVTLTNRSVYAENFGATATAGFRLGQDGRIYVGENGTWTLVNNTEWLSPPSDAGADNYEFLYTVTSGTLSTGPGAGVWHALTANRDLTRSDPPLNWGVQSATVSVQIRRIGTTNTLTTATITLQAFAEPDGLN